MIYFLPPTTELVRDSIRDNPDKLGAIVTPNHGYVLQDGCRVIADNGCFSKKWKPDWWWSWINNLYDLHSDKIVFATCPDVVDLSGSETHLPTLDLWDYWAPRMKDAGIPVAFVCQKGATWRNVPTDADAYFIGGDNDFKLGDDALGIGRHFCSDRWVHMGRVNSLKRTLLAKNFGCDSVDGTFVSFGPNKNLPKVLRWVDAANAYSLEDLWG